MFEKDYARNCENKIILGTSDALSWRPSEPEFYIED